MLSERSRSGAGSCPIRSGPTARSAAGAGCRIAGVRARPGRAAARARCATATSNGCRCCSIGGWWSPWVPPWAHRTGYGDGWRRALRVEAIRPPNERGAPDDPAGLQPRGERLAAARGTAADNPSMAAARAAPPVPGSWFEPDGVDDLLHVRLVLGGRARQIRSIDHESPALDVEDPEAVDLARTLLVAIGRARWVKRCVPERVGGPALEVGLAVARVLVAVREGDAARGRTTPGTSRRIRRG